MSFLNTEGLIYFWSKIKNALNNKADKNHTHNYAGSSSSGGSATSAMKLDTSAGSATQPVYFSGGKPVKTTYTLGKSVPSNALFTDNNTTYSISAVDSEIILTGSDGKKTAVSFTDFICDIDGGGPTIIATKDINGGTP